MEGLEASQSPFVRCMSSVLVDLQMLRNRSRANDFSASSHRQKSERELKRPFWLRTAQQENISPKLWQRTRTFSEAALRTNRIDGT